MHPSLDRTKAVRRIMGGARTWSVPRTRCHITTRGMVQIERFSDTTRRASDVAPPRPEGDGVNTVDFGYWTDKSDGKQYLLHEGACPGRKLGCVRLLDFDDDKLDEADMRFHYRDSWWPGIREPPSGREDLWTVAGHEFGHFIGLAHNHASDWNVMTTEDETPIRRRAHLSIDDYVDLGKYYGP